jgi:hypothetical protein
VIDTAAGQDSRKRPDIALYVDEGNADLGGVAEVVIESIAKPPTGTKERSFCRTFLAENGES